MDFDYSADEQAFRATVRDWLTANLTPELRALDADLATRTELREAWERTLGAAGWIGLSWPAEFGGRGASLVEQLIFAEEYALAGAPVRAFFGEGLLGPTLIAFGTDDQRRRFLPAILRGEEQWCQGFSEPDAGSDLAAVRTRAVRDGGVGGVGGGVGGGGGGGDWVVDGQKTWTSQAATADWIFVLARTDPEAPKHRGLSFLLVPMDQPGVEVRPIRQLTGTAEFNEVYFDGARTAAEFVVGAPGDGWKIATATLGFERGTAFLGQQVRFAREYDRLLDAVRDRGLAGDPVLRQRLADAYVGLQIIRYSGFRTISRLLRGGRPGPESSVGKLLWSRWHQRLGELEMDVLGAPGQIVGDGYALDEFQHSFLFGRAHTIYAGSSEVQRNVVAERVLGLPREPA